MLAELRDFVHLFLLLDSSVDRREQCMGMVSYIQEPVNLLIVALDEFG
jgi:hypothetical protein